MTNHKYHFKDILKFLIPSLIGMLLFVTPIPQNGGITIPVAILSGYLQTNLIDLIPFLLTLIVSISFLGGVLFKLLAPRLDHDSTGNGFFKEVTYTLFDISTFWLIVRGLATIFTLCVFFNIGPDFIIHEDTGGLVFYDLLPTLFSIFLFASLFLPLLIDFGLLELIGSLLIKIMRPLFKLPGRSAIDCIASWLGDGTVGILLTSKQYEEGYYTEREATTIGTTFSLVSITFTLVIIDTVQLSHMFIPFYLTVTTACLVAAIVVPKFGPLKKKRDIFIDGTVARTTAPEEAVSPKEGFNLAVQKASSQNILEKIFKGGIKNLLDMWLGVIPVVMAVGTIALIIAEFTPLFTILGLPFVPVLYVLGIPDAMTAAGTIMAGFADMLLPSIMIANTASDLTRFVVACVSVSQLIYLSEVGAVLLASKIPLTLKELFIIFIQRTLVTLPVIAVLGHLIFTF